MLYLVLAVGMSALVSLIMRLSADRVRANTAMLAVNYLVCSAVAAALAGFRLFPAAPSLGGTLGMGAAAGVLFLAGFVLMQANIRKNGVVLTAVFMRLGLLVPLVSSVFLFGEMPGALQLVGCAVALAGILLISVGPGDTGVQRTNLWMLLLLLLAGGSGDAMSKVYEQLGDPALAPQFLTYTFLVALVLCVGLVLVKKERPGRQELLFGLLIGVPNFFSVRFLLLSLNSVPAMIAYPTYSVATILVITMAGVLFFKEKLNPRQWLALAVILAALVLLNL